MPLFTNRKINLAFLLTSQRKRDYMNLMYHLFSQTFLEGVCGFALEDLLKSRKDKKLLEDLLQVKEI